MATQKPAQHPLNALTGLRFFAAIQVVLFHFGAGFAERHHFPGPGISLLSSGWCSVCLFFILSGFVLAYSHQGKIDGMRSCGAFWQARFARIYPVYLLSLLLCFEDALHISVKLRLAALTMVQSWNPFHPGYGGDWNMPSWTLSVEAFFYLLFPLLLVLIEKLPVRALWVLFTSMLAIIVIFGTALNEPVPHLHGFPIPLPVLRLPEFIVGLSAGLLFCRGVRLPFAGLISLASVVAILALEMSGHPDLLRYIILPFTFLIFSLSSGAGMIAKVLSTRFLILLGGASYSIYLLQMPVRRGVHALLGRPGSNLDTYVFVPILICFSILVFHFYEEPLRRSIRRIPLFSKKAQRPAAA